MTTTSLSEALTHLRESGYGAEADAMESALASAEPVAWYAPSIDDTCTAAKKAQRERDLPETARLFTVPLVYAHTKPAAKVEALDNGDVEAWLGAYALGRPCENPHAVEDARLALYQRRVALEHSKPAQSDSQTAFERIGLTDVPFPSVRKEQPTPASVPDGYVIAPHFRGFADLGLGRYRLFHSRAGVEAELCIVPATHEEVAGRVVGDLRDDGPDEIPAELMAVRLRFENVAGLDALEQQLRLLRETHFLTPPTKQEGTTP